MTISWAWWTLNESAQVVTDWRKPPPPDLRNWSYDDPSAVIFFGSGAHNMRFGTLSRYVADLTSFIRKYRSLRRTVKARMIWLASSANHVLDDELDCSPDPELPAHRMNFHRSMLFSAVGADVMRSALPMLDMWRPTADQHENCAKVHYDELYVPQGNGFVSRMVANLMLNMACNARLLPQAEIFRDLD